VTLAPTMAAPARGPMTGLAAQLTLLVALAATLGLTPAGLVAGALYGLVLCGLLAAGLQRAEMTRMGAANVVTFSRAILVGGVTALVVTSFAHPVSTPALVVVAGLALALDGVDGQVARRTGCTTALGARFDMEIDAFLILVLSVYAGDRFGWWTVAIGAFRYLLAAASWSLPWSFGRDVGWLYRAWRVRAEARRRWSTGPGSPRRSAERAQATRAIEPGTGTGTASGCRIAAIASTPSTRRGPGRTTRPSPSIAHT
jgi:phosphatidylglycerophosphate synthase